MKNTIKIKKNHPYAKEIYLINRACDFLETHKWVKDNYAVDKNNCDTEPASKNACGWCAMGVLYKLDKSPALLVTRAIEDLFYSKFNNSIITFNDNQSRKRNVIRKMRSLAKLLATEA